MLVRPVSSREISRRAAMPVLALTFPEPDIAVLTFSDPDRSVNVLARAVLDELESRLQEIAARQPLAGLIICSGKPGVFLAGADVHELAKRVTTATRDEIAAACRRGRKLFTQLAKIACPTVAAVDGVCLGGGTELASWCDRRVVAENSQTTIGCPEVKLGMFPGWGGTVRLPRLIGLGPAVELITGGEPITWETAVKIGWADDHASSERLIGAAIELIRREQANPVYRSRRQAWAGRVEMPAEEIEFLAATARDQIRRVTKGHIPAPEMALELMVAGSRVGEDEAGEMETERLASHWGSTTHRALLSVHLLREQNRKASGAKTEPTRAVERLGVVGSGLMGAGIAGIALRRDLPVAVHDASAEALERGARQIVEQAAYDRKRKGPDPARAQSLSQRLRASDKLENLADCDLVIEAIVENADVKRQLFAQLEPLVAPDAILASNTSTIPISRQQESLQRPDRFCGMHFFNPVRILPLVEVIRGQKTSESTLAAAIAFAKRIGKLPIVVNDGPGFLVNRLLFPYLNEALQLFSEGVALEEIDAAAIEFGMPVGPIELYDMVGIDTAVFAGRVIWSAFPDRVKPSPILPAMLKAGRMGKKVGVGFFRYSPDKGERESDSSIMDVIGHYRATSNSMTRGQILDRLLLPMLLEGTRTLEDRIVDDPRVVDFGVIHGLGFPAFRGGLMFWADTMGLETLLNRCEPLRELGPRFDPPRLLRELVAAQRCYYDLPGLSATAAPST
jgi:3-hydroxyacyl-CoA dehydrogenase/enoyl-CoA hydratase/carnithine racemase